MTAALCVLSVIIYRSLDRRIEDLLEAKWQNSLFDAKELDRLTGQLSRE